MRRYTVEARGLRREFGPKRFVAVEDVSLAIAPGEIACVLGPNGAGKTTTVKMLSTLLTPTAGTITVDGIDAIAHPRQARSRIGLVLGGDKGFYNRASARDNLLFFADVLGAKKKTRHKSVDQALEAVSLTDRAGDPVESYSRGMRQRLHIARGLLTSPKLLLLDEPTSGLDPEIARDIRSLVRRFALAGTAVLLTTHYLVEAEQLADSLTLIMSGKVVAEGDAGAIAARSQVAMITTASLDQASPAVIEKLQALPHAGPISTETRTGRTHIYLPWTGKPALDQLHVVLAEAGEAPADLVTRKATLEESYLALVTQLGGRA